MKGVITALVTPFKKNGKVDFVNLSKLLLFQQNSSVDGIVILGSTGEASTLTDNESLEIIKLAIKIFKRDIWVGINDNSTARLLEKQKLFDILDFKGYLLGSPYYNKPTQQGLINHITKFCKNTSKSVCLYNVPSRTGVALNEKTIEALCGVNNIVAIKEASGDINYWTNLIRCVGKKINIICGNDTEFLPMLASGAKGCVSVISNILPELPCKIYNEYYKENQISTELSNKYLKMCNLLFIETNPVPIKYILSKYNMCLCKCREPLCSLKRKSKNKINKELNIIFND